MIKNSLYSFRDRHNSSFFGNSLVQNGTPNRAKRMTGRNAPSTCGNFWQVPGLPEQMQDACEHWHLTCVGGGSSFVIWAGT
jgi:hypothetical protein